jgi:hypothetical protein
MTTRNTPKLALARGNNNTIVLKVLHAYGSAIDELTTSLGILPDGLADSRSIVCSSPQELDAARNPLAHYFDARGEWIKDDYKLADFANDLIA